MLCVTLPFAGVKECHRRRSSQPAPPYFRAQSVPRVLLPAWRPFPPQNLSHGAPFGHAESGGRGVRYHQK